MTTPTFTDDRLDGARATVMGLGRFGGGLGATRWLLARGARVTLTDLRDEHALDDALGALDTSDPRLNLRLGAHDKRDFARADIVVVNPAVPKPWENRFVRTAEDAGAHVTTEARLALERVPERVRTIAITGTTGKSTTTAMLGAALEASYTGGAVHIGGNIGGSLLDTIHDLRPGDALVVELSSAQLHWLAREPRWTPDIALVTNLAPNHLDWHGTMEHYEACKRAIVGERLCCHEGPIEEWGEGANMRTVTDDDLAALPALTLPGEHNARNAALAMIGARWALELNGQADEDARAHAERAIAAFDGLDHRLRTLGYARAVRIVDDSKCTTPEGVALAVRAFDPARVYLIAGGADKGVDLAPMIEAGAACAHAWCIGSTGPTIARLITDAGGRATDCATLDDAVAHLARVARPADVALLSPGCASWDQFPHYIARAHAFREAIERHLGPIADTEQK